MDGRIKFSWVSFDFTLEVIVPFLRVKVTLEPPPPPTLIISDDKHPNKVLRHQFFSALLKSSVIMRSNS